MIAATDNLCAVLTSCVPALKIGVTVAVLLIVSYGGFDVVAFVLPVLLGWRTRGLSRVRSDAAVTVAVLGDVKTAVTL